MGRKQAWLISSYPPCLLGRTEENHEKPQSVDGTSGE